MILMHNHLTCYPCFSRDDRMNNKKLISFAENNKLPMIVGSAVYADRKIVYLSNDKRLYRKWIAMKLK